MLCLTSRVIEKFKVPAGAYVRNADYYWSFNEFADSGANEIFQNTGEYSFGLFNASTSHLQQNNDSINGDATWYTVKFNKYRKQCIKIPGFEAENHTCIADPGTCTEGLSMEVWVKFQQADFESQVIQTIVAAAGGYGGFFLYQLGRQISVIIADGEQYWLLEKNLPSAILADEWFNVAFRWRTDLGVQMFINGALVEEIPFSRVRDESTYMPSDNKLYVGCRVHNQEEKDYSNAEMDELAFWIKYLPDEDLKYFTGEIIPNSEVESNIFLYQDDIVELLPIPPSAKNPYYTVADVYEPCDDSVTFTNGIGIVNITRGHGQGIDISELNAADVTIDNTNNAGVADLDSAALNGLSFSFWVLPDMTDSDTELLFKASNWRVSIVEGNLTLKARYSTVEVVNETLSIDYITEDILSVNISLEYWTNVAFSWDWFNGIILYINGYDKTSEANIERTEETSQVGDPDSLTLMRTTRPVIISDIIVWKRTLYDFEVYRFLGMSPSESYLMHHADLYWSTDYYVTQDQVAMGTWLPLYQQLNSNISSVDNSGIAGTVGKGQAMEVDGANDAWVMLGMVDSHGVYEAGTGAEFAGTCISDPSLCEDGLTVALWLRIYSVPTDTAFYSIMSSGEQDSYSRGFSISLQDEQLHMSIVNGLKYWRVSIAAGEFPVDDWMHLSFTWMRQEGLWVFINGELVGANKDGVNHVRNYDRFNRVTLGRNNANNNFGSYLQFAFQEIAIYLKFTVTYRIREVFALIDNKYYETADYYYNKEEIITSDISTLVAAHTDGIYIGPNGGVRAFNNTAALGDGSFITLDYAPVAECFINPTNCPNGLTVSLWARNNLFLASDDPIIYILSSHSSPEDIISGDTQGWTIYYSRTANDPPKSGNMWMVTIVAGDTKYDVELSTAAKDLKAQRWTNLAFTYQPNDIKLFADGQVSAIAASGVAVTPSAPAGTKESLMIGHPDNNNKTFIDVFNVAVWEKYYYSSNAYELTGHTDEVIQKYAKADLMWPFDGPIHMVNTKYSEIKIQHEIYDKSLRGAAVQVTRDGRYNASLGNYSSECITQPSSCASGFQLGAQLMLGNYIPGDLPDDKIGSILLLGSPDAIAYVENLRAKNISEIWPNIDSKNFEGLAVQILKEDGQNKLSVIVANNEYVWQRTIDIEIDRWFDIVIGWNIQDGIAIKVDNKKQSGPQLRKSLKFGSSKLITNKLILGVGSGGGTSQAIDASYNDISIIYNSKVTVEQEGRCYDTAYLYYRLNAGQIFTMENVFNKKDRALVADSGFHVEGDGYVVLDQFVDKCFSDPSLCTQGMSLSFYVKVVKLLSAADTLVSSGYPHTRGFQIVASAPADAESENITITVALNNGEKTWENQVAILRNKWANVAFVWHSQTGLIVFVEGQRLAADERPVTDTKPAKTSRNSLVLGRSNDASDTDFTNAIFDDFALWDLDLRDDELLSYKLNGLDCGDISADLLMEAEVLEVVEDDEPVAVVEEGPGCKYYTDVKKGTDVEEGAEAQPQVCTNSTSALIESLNNQSVPINNILTILEVLDADVAFFNESMHPVDVDLEQFVLVMETVVGLTVENDINPDDAHKTMSEILSIGDNLLDADTWAENWVRIEKNRTKGPAGLIEDISELAVILTSKMALGQDKEDDCTTFKGGSSQAMMSCEKRRLMLCDRDYIFPQYDKLAEDEKTNQTLNDWLQPTDRVHIPTSVWPRANFPDDAIVSVAVVIYNEADGILPTRMSVETFYDTEATTSADNPEDAENPDIIAQSTLNSRIVSITVDPPITPPLQECVQLFIEHKKRNHGNKRRTHCAFWDRKQRKDEGGAWSSEGCDKVMSNETHTECCCWHLTSFAIMIEPLIEEVIDTTTQKINYITYACLALSGLSLLVFCFIILCNKSLRSERNMVHLNLSIAMILATASYFSVMFAKDTPLYCQIAAIAQHYFFMVAYAWILMEAMCLFYAVLYGALMGKMSCYAPFAWLAPVIPVVICVAVYLDMYGTNEKCWLSYNNYVVMAMLGPILLFIVLDAAVLLIIVCNLPQPTLKREDILSEVRWAVFYALLLVPVLGFTWILPLLEVMKVALPLSFQYVYTTLMCLQGFFVFLVYGLGQRSVRMAVMRKKYQPANSRATSVLLGSQTDSGASSHVSLQNSSMDSGYVEVKPQPMSRPTSRSSKERSSPRPNSQNSRKSELRQSARRRPSSAESRGYIP